jgi:glycosyltransferase involved in cell wall biosynthesis
MSQLSVILCAHNPRADYLNRVLQALRQQTLHYEEWELLLIDNASSQQLSGAFEVSWHPRGRHLREDNLGLTRARLRGIKETKGGILVLVDADNVLESHYLERVREIAAMHPSVGAWSGNVDLEFEKPPPAWTEPFWPFLVQRRVELDVAVCSSELKGPLPAGAGLCVRRVVAEHYSAQMEKSPWRRALDRKGTSLISAGDLDLALTACDIGLNCGLFKSLRLQHLIPPERLSERYLLELVEGIQLSSCILEMCRDPRRAPPRISWWWWVKFGCDCVTKFGRKRRFYLANKRAQRQARVIYESLNSSGLVSDAGT